MRIRAIVGCRRDAKMESFSMSTCSRGAANRDAAQLFRHLPAGYDRPQFKKPALVVFETFW
jgi:hypothetical protein